MDISGINMNDPTTITRSLKAKQVLDDGLTVRDSSSISGQTGNDPGLIDPAKIPGVNLGAVASVLLNVPENQIKNEWSIPLEKGSGEMPPEPVFRFDGIYVSGGGDVRKFDYDGKEAWKVEVGGLTESKPAFDSEGNVYISSEQRYQPDGSSVSNGPITLISITPDGKERWRTPAGIGYECREALVDGDKVYTVNQYREDSPNVFCTSTSSKPLWSLHVKDPYRKKPYIDGSGKLNVVGGNGFHNYVIDPAHPDGPKVVDDVKNIPHRFEPVKDAQGNTYCIQDDKLRKLDANRNEVWAKDLTGKVDFPYVMPGPDGNVYTLTEHRYLACFAPDGTKKWELDNPLKDRISEPTWGADGTCYVTNQEYNDASMEDGKRCGVYAINPDGSIKWHHKEYGSIGWALTVGTDGTVITGGGQFPMRGYNAGAGERIFEFSDSSLSRVTSLHSGPDQTFYAQSDEKMTKFHYQSLQDLADTAAAIMKQGQEEGNATPAVTQNGETVDIDGATLKKRKKLFDVTQMGR